MKKLKYYLIILNLILGLSGTSAQEPNIARSIDKLEFKGNISYSQKELQKLLQIKPKDKFDSEAVNKAAEKIRSFYVSQGYYLAEVSCKTHIISSKVQLLFLIQENSRATVGDFRLQGNKFFGENYLKQEFRLRAGNRFA